MPEGPECRRITEKLRVRLKGKLLLWIDWVPNTKYSPHFDRYYNELESLFPSTCLDILCRGKQIFFFFENRIAFISSLGTEGHWYYFNRLDPKLQSYRQGAYHPKFCLHFGKQIERNGFNWCLSDIEIWYDDLLSRGNFTVTNWTGAFDKMIEIGPDLLATTVPFKDIHLVISRQLPERFYQPAVLQQFITEIRRPRRSNMDICKFLMKQEYFSGIGNYLKSESLYRAKIHPKRVLGSLTDAEIETLFSMCLTTIAQAYQYGGLTHGTFLDPDMEKGKFIPIIYKRKGQLDPNGYVIQYIKEKDPDGTGDGRSTYFVPEVQK